MDVIVTDHGKQRVRKRVGISKKSVERLVNIAYHKGITHKSAPSFLKRYFYHLWKKYESANNIRIYGDLVYIFHNNILITVFHIPPKFNKLH